MKIPRDVNGEDLVRALRVLGYALPAKQVRTCVSRRKEMESIMKSCRGTVR